MIGSKCIIYILEVKSDIGQVQLIPIMNQELENYFHDLKDDKNKENDQSFFHL